MTTDTEKRKKYHVILELLLLVIALVIVLYWLRGYTPKLIRLLKDGNVSEIERYITSEGEKGRFVLILLQMIETVAILLPAMPVYICAGAIYGKAEGILMCYLTNLVMNAIIFLIARKLKISAAEFAKFQKNSKLEERMRQTKHPGRIVFLMCMLPIIPNGMIPYISAQTNVTLPEFLGALAIGCFPGIAVFVCCGDFLLSEHFEISLPVLLLLVVCICIAMLFKNKIVACLDRTVLRKLS